MIVTVTPNPSFDRTVEVDELGRGEVNRILRAQTEAGGKGINVSRALALSDVDTVCVFPAGQPDASTFVAMLGSHERLQVHVVDTGSPIRTNTSVIEADGETTKLNEAGADFAVDSVRDLLDAVAEVSNGAAWIASCGSLPPGMGPDFHRRIIEQVDGTATRVAVDASGEALAEAVAGGCHLIKPNHHELAELAGVELHTLGDVADAAAEVQRSGVETVVVSLGADGALLVNDDGMIHGVAPTDAVRNTVGAGDAFLAGLLSGGGLGAESLSEALAWGRAAVRSPTTSFPPADAADRAAVRLTEAIDRSSNVGNQ